MSAEISLAFLVECFYRILSKMFGQKSFDQELADDAAEDIAQQAVRNRYDDEEQESLQSFPSTSITVNKTNTGTRSFWTREMRSGALVGLVAALQQENCERPVIFCLHAQLLAM